MNSSRPVTTEMKSTNKIEEGHQLMHEMMDDSMTHHAQRLLGS